MSYQKQKGTTINSFEESDLASFVEDQSTIQKKKRIQKDLDKNVQEKQELYVVLNRNKKQTAKEIKRIRQQNRRATHKQYVVSLQQEIKKKEVQIQNLSARIKDLQKELQNKVCHKCGNQKTQIQSLSPISIEHELPLEPFQQMEDCEESFRRINDQSSLRICFGNKNLFFFLVTMCCLTIGSIADNPQIFLQPIVPFKLKSQMCHLSQFHKLNKFNLNSKFKHSQNENKFEMFEQTPKFSKSPTIFNTSKKVSDFFNLKFVLSKFLPRSISFLPNLKDPRQMLLGFGTNQVLRRFLVGRYINF